MSEFVCPECRGGFPELAHKRRCPWCGTKMDGEFETPSVHTVTKVENGDEDETHPRGLSRLLVGGGR